MISDVYTGDDLINWLNSDDAVRQARRLVQRYGLRSAEAVADDVLQDARVAVLLRMQRGPLPVKNPGGYGTQVLKREVSRILRGRYDTVELPDEGPEGDQLRVDLPGDDQEFDDLRVAMERTRQVKPWVISAMLSVVTLRAYPAIHLSGVPAPRAGATPDQALVWPALWFAGQRDHFPHDDDDAKERNRKNQGRSRMVREVIERYNAACAAFTHERVTDHG